MFATIFKPREIHKLNQGNGVLYLDTYRYLQGGEVSDKTTLKMKRTLYHYPEQWFNGVCSPVTNLVKNPQQAYHPKMLLKTNQTLNYTLYYYFI